jgi:hypothetical protein
MSTHVYSVGKAILFTIPEIPSIVYKLKLLSAGTILEIPSTEKSVDSLLSEINPLGRFHQIVLLLLFCGAAPIVGFQVRISRGKF